MQERQPRSTGELLSDALALFRRHLKPFYLLTLPFCAFDLVVREAGNSAIQATKALDPAQAADVQALLQALVGVVAGIGLFVASLMILQLVSVGVVAMTDSLWNQRGPGGALGAIASRGAAGVVTMALLFLAFGGVWAVPFVAAVGAGVGATVSPALAVVLILVAALLVAAALVVTVLLGLRWALYLQAVVIESRAGPGAFARSSELMAGRGLPLVQGPKFRFSVLFLVVVAVTGSLQVLFLVPRLVVAVSTGWAFADGMPPLASMPLWFIIPFGLLEVATNALVVPFAPVLLTLFYYDLRVRYEALDLG